MEACRLRRLGLRALFFCGEVWRAVCPRNGPVVGEGEPSNSCLKGTLSVEDKGGAQLFNLAGLSV